MLKINSLNSLNITKTNKNIDLYSSYSSCSKTKNIVKNNTDITDITDISTYQHEFEHEFEDGFEHGFEDGFFYRFDVFFNSSFDPHLFDIPYHRLETISFRDRENYMYYYSSGLMEALDCFVSVRYLQKRVLNQLEIFHTQKQILRKIDRFLYKNYSKTYDSNILGLISKMTF